MAEINGKYQHQNPSSFVAKSKFRQTLQNLEANFVFITNMVLVKSVIVKINEGFYLGTFRTNSWELNFSRTKFFETYILGLNTIVNFYSWAGRDGDRAGLLGIVFLK